MADFDAAFLLTVVENEGPWSNDPSDPGGETIYGITRKHQPTWEGWVLVDELKKKQGFPGGLANNDELMTKIKAFYRSGPWKFFRGDELPDQKLAEKLFDAGVNCGLARVLGWLIRGLNGLNRNNRDWPDLPRELKMTDEIFKALTSYLNVRHSSSTLLKTINAQQGIHYLQIAEANPTLEKFGSGWWTKRIS